MSSKQSSSIEFAHMENRKIYVDFHIIIHYNIRTKGAFIMQRKLENIIAVIDYIELHLHDKLNLEIVASAVGYSKYHLHRMFTKTVGLSIHDYIQRRQLTEAGKLLVFSNRPIMEIALLAGYESQQAFTDVFKQMYKKTPNEFRKGEEFYSLQLRFRLKKDMINTSVFDTLMQDIRYATEKDIPIWMDLVYLIIDGFPNLNEQDYLKGLNRSIQEKNAWILNKEGMAIAIMIFDYETGCIEFFGVHPLYRNYEIANRFIHKVTENLMITNDIFVTTFREGDKADTGYRDTFQALGFTEAELLTEYGYPTQKFILPITRKEDHK